MEGTKLVRLSSIVVSLWMSVRTLNLFDDFQSNSLQMGDSDGLDRQLFFYLFALDLAKIYTRLCNRMEDRRLKKQSTHVLSIRFLYSDQHTPGRRFEELKRVDFIYLLLNIDFSFFVLLNRFFKNIYKVLPFVLVPLINVYNMEMVPN